MSSCMLNTSNLYLFTTEYLPRAIVATVVSIKKTEREMVIIATRKDGLQDHKYNWVRIRQKAGLDV
jgi:hypothetical protein